MKNETERLEALRVKIIQWADEKGILSKATPEKQFLKFMEETGALAKAILTSDSHEFIDAIGDVFVTIVIHAELSGKVFKMAGIKDMTSLNDDLFSIMAYETNEGEYLWSTACLLSIY